MRDLTSDLAGRFARLTLGHLGQEYPNKLDHVLECASDARTPSELHPAFFGSFDWHSCVHGWWQVMHILRRFPNIPAAAVIRERADLTLTPENITGELAYLERPSARGFERPYGWAWTLALHGELARHSEGQWASAVAPLASAFAERFRSFLPLMTYPIRHGIHTNTAFALVLAHDWARSRDRDLSKLIERSARYWFTNDRACQAWEPSGDEFLSPALCEALLMSRMLSGDEFVAWFERFLPEAQDRAPATLFKPAFVSDRSDGKIGHLDGLNLSRAWCWREIAAALGPAHPVSKLADDTAQQHLDAALPHVAGDYMGEHWLATFALLAMGERGGNLAN